MTKTKTTYSRLNLQLFAEEAAAAGAAGEGMSTAGDPSTPSPAGENTPEVTYVYGKQKDNGTAQGAQTENKRPSFEELIRSDEYKDEAKAYMKKQIQNRFKNVNAENQKMREILGYNNARYGLDPNSATYLDDYAAKVKGDTKLYEDEAMAAGMDVDTYMKVKNAERIIAQNEQMNRSREQQELINQHVQSLYAQSAQLKEKFPDFDIESEIENDTFKRLVDPPALGGAGLSVENAFYVVHHNEINQAIATGAVNAATQKVAASVAANRARPTENIASNKTSVRVMDDPSKFTKDDFERIKAEYLRTGKMPSF